MKIPKYYRVKHEILALMADLDSGDSLPTERQLAEQFATSRTTVRQAIAELVVDGRLERTQGSGTFVAPPKLMQVRQLTSFSADLSDDGWRPGSIVLEIDELAATPRLARHLEVPENSHVHRVRRVRTAQDRPIALETAHLPGPLPDLAAGLDARGSLYRTLEQDHGILLHQVEDMVETSLASPTEADVLQVETGMPMLLVHRTARDPDGRVVEWTRSVFRGDRFRFIARSTRGGSA